MGNKLLMNSEEFRLINMNYVNFLEFCRLKADQTKVSDLSHVSDTMISTLAVYLCIGEVVLFLNVQYTTIEKTID